VAVVGVGIDALEVDRMHVALTRTPSLRERLFTPGEQAVATPARLAARFAAKEAVAKALGTGLRGFAWRDVEVVTDELGRPTVTLHGGAARRAAELGVTAVHLSLATTPVLALANAVLEG
jgi:holo-[acyl-carrier protein] synthase